MCQNEGRKSYRRKIFYSKLKSSEVKSKRISSSYVWKKLNMCWNYRSPEQSDLDRDREAIYSINNFEHGYQREKEIAFVTEWTVTVVEDIISEVFHYHVSYMIMSAIWFLRSRTCRSTYFLNTEWMNVVWLSLQYRQTDRIKICCVVEIDNVWYWNVYASLIDFLCIVISNLTRSRNNWDDISPYFSFRRKFSR